MSGVFSAIFEKLLGVGVRVKSIDVNPLIEVSLEEKVRGGKSGDRGGQETSPEHDINLPGKASLIIDMVSLAVCGVAPSC